MFATPPWMQFFLTARYRNSGYSWPPCFPSWFSNSMRQIGATEREAEVIYFYELSDPMSESAVDDTCLNVSQSINRCVLKGKDHLPCLTPGARLYWRRARQWMLGPEVARCQGFELDPVSIEYTHREVVHLFGNGFSAVSLDIAILIQMFAMSGLQQLARARSTADLKTVSCTAPHTQDGGGWSDDVCDSLARQLSDEFSSCDATAQRLL